MRGKTVVITGATSGIGEVAAIRLAEQGARIVFTARNKARADSTMEKLRKANADADHAVLMADLSLLAEMKRVGEVIAAEPKIDILINNAGALFNTRVETADGLEKTFALNHMSYFVITNLVLPKLQAGGADHLHRFGGTPALAIELQRSADPARLFRISGLCQIQALQCSLHPRIGAAGPGSGVTANCLHPGFVATRFGDQSGGITSVFVKLAKPVGAISPEEGTKTILYLATSPEVGRCQRRIFLRVQNRHAFGRSPQ